MGRPFAPACSKVTIHERLVTQRAGDLRLAHGLFKFHQHFLFLIRVELEIIVAGLMRETGQLEGETMLEHR